ncbi:MAG: tetratricopeptide repeat protein, partial [Thermodesulfovibrionales bacterium]
MISKLEKVLLARPYIILMLLVVLAFANALQNSFVGDDFAIIVNNPNINLPAKEIMSTFTQPLAKLAGFQKYPQVYYRPVLSLYFIMNYKIWGMNPVGFHLTGILLYILTVLVLYRASMILFNNNENGRLISLVGASIFAVHPINSEMAGRAASGEILLGFFIILSLYFFLREKKYLSWSTFALALLSKEAAVMLPFALVILSIDRKGIKKGLLAMIPYVILIGAYLILRATFVDTVLGDRIEQPIFTRILTMSVATLDYIKLFLIPYPLHLFYPAKWYTSLTEPKVVLAIVVLLLISSLAFKLRKDKIMLFLLLFPFIMLAPVIWRVNAFPYGFDLTYIAERFLYISIMPFSLFVSASTARLTNYIRRKYIEVVWIVVIMILITITAYSNMRWKNNLTFYQEISRELPNADYAHNNLGVALVEQGKLDEAIQEYLTALKLKPNDAMVLCNIGNVYARKGQLDKAIQEYLTAIRLKPDYQESYHNLGLVYFMQGRLTDSIQEYTIALRLKPDAAKTHSNIADVYIKLGEIDKGIEHYQTALRLRPDIALTHNNLGLAYKQKGLINEARQEFETALKIYPYFIYARQNL